MIRLVGVAKSFDRPVLRGIDLHVPRGCLYGLVGPGAAGKSIALKIIASLLVPDRGSVTVDGRDVLRMSEPELRAYRRSIGMVFQNNALFDFMTVAENVAFPLRRMGVLGDREIAARVSERLERVGLRGFESRLPAGLSGGQKKRVGIARATVTNAPLMLCDEPAAGLDPVTSQRIFDLLRAEQQRQSSTIIMVSSDIDRLLTVTDRVGLMNDGGVVFDGSTADALESALPIVRQFLHGDLVGAIMKALGRAGLGIVRIVGGLGVLFGRIVSRLLRLDLDGEELLSNMYKMGVKSLPIVAVTALFTGGIMVVQSAPTVERFGAHGLLGWGVGFGTLREVGPLLTALMISGRVGANNTAELATMVVTEQFDALRALAIDPVSFLIVPRFVGIVVTLFLSTIFADALALLGAAYAGLPLLGVDPRVFYEGLTGGLLGIGDVVQGLLKSVVFGVVVALSSCEFGMTATGGAPGVGRAVNATVVVSAAGIFVLDYLVSFAVR